MSDTDHVARLRAWRAFSDQNRPGHDHMRDVSYESAPVCDADLDAALDELERLRAQQRPALGNAYAVGWEDAVATFRTPGWAEREAGWKRFLGEVGGGAVPQRPDLEPELPDRHAKLLAAIRREGGDFSPLRARTELLEAGYAVTSERAHQIMRQLAERGYLEQVRPRAYTYRLKAEARQSSENGGEVPG